jgi:hypothetical protein
MWAAVTRVGPVIACVLATACGGRQTSSLRQPPRPGVLQVLDTIEQSVSFPISSVAGRPDCSLLLADARFGRIALLNSADHRLSIVAKVPGTWQAVHLTSVDDEDVLVWSDDRPYLAMLDLSDSRITPFQLGRHPWGGAAIGPLVGLQRNRYAVISAGDPGAAREESPTRERVPLVEVRDPSGALDGSSGAVAERGGRYLSWWGARSAIGRAADTVLVLDLGDAVLRRLVDANGTVRDAGTIGLPRYFKAAPPREWIEMLPWILVHGALWNVAGTPALQMATIGPQGTVYVIRNTGFIWHTLESGLLASRGVWRPTGQTLEIYSTRGTFLGAYALPVERVFWIEADGRGRLFFSNGSRVVVTQDPSAPATRCGRLGRVTTR